MGLTGALRRVGINVVPSGIQIIGSMTADNVAGDQGVKIYVDPTSGSNSNTGRTPGTAVSTIAAGYAKLTAGQNDTLVYLSGTTSASIVDTLTWAKDYTHFVGVCAPISNQPRARIFNSGNSTAGNNLLKITSKGGMFKNLRFFQGSAIATAYSVEVTGNYNYFENVTFQGMGNATPAGSSANYSLKLAGCGLSDFVHCTIGGSSTKRTADNSVILLDTVSSQLHFAHCKILSYAETNTYCMVKVADNAGAENYVWFEDCMFYNRWAGCADLLLEVFEIPDMSANKQLGIFLTGGTFNAAADEWATGDRGVIWVAGPVAAAGTAGAGSSGSILEPS